MNAGNVGIRRTETDLTAHVNSISSTLSLQIMVKSAIQDNNE